MVLQDGGNNATEKAATFSTVAPSQPPAITIYRTSTAYPPTATVIRHTCGIVAAVDMHLLKIVLQFAVSAERRDHLQFSTGRLFSKDVKMKQKVRKGMNKQRTSNSIEAPY